MAFTHGRKARFKVNGNSIDLYGDNSDLEQLTEVAETTVYTVNSKTFVTGLKDSKFTFSGRVDPTVDGYLSALVGADPVTFEYGPQGSTPASGAPKFTGSLILTNYKINSPLNAAATFSCNAQITGDVTRATY